MLLLVTALFAASGAAQPVRDTPVINPSPEAKNCPETPMSLARKMGSTPHAVPLNKLPPGQIFMAVDRRISGCPAPLTMTDYRNSRGR
ncbi:hypothetical protein [Sphingomonas flavescens]|uniref:hypothetical protein n=1 Tax=Sphingomonas flavescens TaxID=3132797 RepID=UPI0028049069|nr:hypothetical protein [Sphingomonas limnosediminicola]